MSLALEPPDDFNHPYKPYDIQSDLMRHVYKAIECSRPAIVESPTGTGKSLSLICSTLSWLRDNTARAQTVVRADLQAQLAHTLSDEPAWVIEQEIARRLRELTQAEQDLTDRLTALREKEANIKRAKARANHTNKRQKVSHESETSPVGDADEEKFAPDEQDGEGEDDGLTPEVRQMMHSYHNRGNRHSSDADDEPDVTKVYYASRTHSQLAQFVQEIRKTSFADTTRIVPLGSRASLCINDKLKKACGGNTETLNERCLELQKAEKGSRCEFLPSQEEEDKMIGFRDRILATTLDLEDLEDLGRATHVCPYYGSRRAIRQAHVVTLPYNMLLQHAARESLGISLKGHIVIIDEAHNLIDTVLSINTVSIASTSISNALSGVQLYLQRFKTRLKGSNTVYLKQLLAIFRRLEAYCITWSESRQNAKAIEELMLPKALMEDLQGSIDQVDLHKLAAYMKTSKIAHKISGYANMQAEKQARAQQKPNKHKVLLVNAVYQIQSFLLALTNPSRDGRIIVSRAADSSNVSLRYLLLNPADSFRSIVDDARSVILAGGTMSPLSDFDNQLFGHLAADQKPMALSCGHVVPRQNISVSVIRSGPTKQDFRFTYENRDNLAMLQDLGSAIATLARVCPAGIVCFVPSYAFLDKLQAVWKSSGMIERIRKNKLIFMEPKTAGEVDAVLKGYSTANSSGNKGAILFAVVGAKLSEGINFADDMARAVIIVGIPYPNAASTELKERMHHLSAESKKRKEITDGGDQLYSNLAFRAVNQSIGRAIRHANDWASILLIDTRYATPALQAKLPQWIASEVQVPESFGLVLQKTARFRSSHVVT
ncbi:uncharacterized protein L969DRAFT_94096 [Mixia osmundae IAM 14324]|uniref:ATP-dependent DNA helicase CHL1 n=1 Tax=Mixia osmundae (strain CBS 9802 / IAM 14324 / JCM 22182 / KY 12970) TaxID=764103 RepID=G7E929_MIXOS|nr:uncharacterized protein L969DRAFT_94096 [Mixia osmundae IAM 14324]KEI40283.1 hypothetical protein L969DRAFT_94096 [Mixia osmundae IAM 14324]GAA99647.1 hypothetical protein E5Q_06350 [Mixia osmundae IAM 14324]